MGVPPVSERLFQTDGRTSVPPQAHAAGPPPSPLSEFGLLPSSFALPALPDAPLHHVAFPTVVAGALPRHHRDVLYDSFRAGRAVHGGESGHAGNPAESGKALRPR